MQNTKTESLAPTQTPTNWHWVVTHLQACASRMQQQHGLTPSEARFLHAFLKNCDIRLAARSLGLTEGSGRFVLKVVFRKTGTRKQAELMRLALGIPCLPCASPVVAFPAHPQSPPSDS